MAQSDHDDDVRDWNMVSSYIQDPEGDSPSEYLGNMSKFNGCSNFCPSNSSLTSNAFSHTVDLSSIAQAAGGSDLNFPTGLALQGQHVDDHGTQGAVKDPEVHVNPPKRRDQARANNDSTKPKRLRAPNWTEEEKNVLLMYKLEALKRGKSFTNGASWNSHVSKILLEKHNFDRSPTSCQQQWDTLKKQHDTIQDHESKITKGSSSASYWDLKDNDIRELNLELPSNEKLPKEFYFAWYVLMEEIMRTSFDAKKAPTISRTTSIQVGANVASTSAPVPSTTTITPEPILLPPSDGRISPFSSQDIQVSTQRPPQASLCINLANQQHEEEVLGIMPCTQGSQPRPECVEDMPNNDLNSMIAPFVNKLIEDKLEDKLEFVKSVLLSREENEQKYRDKVLALKREKLALRREEVEYLTRRVATSCIIDTNMLSKEQVGAACNLASTSDLSPRKHIAGEYNDVRIMQDDQFPT